MQCASKSITFAMFFMVLDLRLTRLGFGGIPFFMLTGLEKACCSCAALAENIMEEQGQKQQKRRFFHSKLGYYGNYA